jgi:hypothetical protein
MADNKTLLAKALSGNSEPNKEEVLDILFYLKQIFGLVLGVLIAVTGLMGLPGLIAFGLGSSLLSYLYVFKFLGVEDDVIETQDVLK